MKKKILFLVILFSPFIIKSQTYDKQKEICELILQTSFDNQLYLKETNDIMIEVAQNFMFFPYKSGTLEDGNFERLIINLNEFDCVTFVENTLALTKVIKNKQTDFKDFKRELQKIRYRNGQILDYTSRLHYFSDWIFDNEKLNFIKDLTPLIGGKPYIKDIGFMSENYQKYKNFKAIFLKNMQKIEKKISERKYFYIPKYNLVKIASNIKDGDIIAITIARKDLDISHVGLAFYKDKELHFLHASSKAKNN